MCQWCTDDPEKDYVPQEKTKILRTQDILLAYKPCYVVTTISEKETSLKLSRQTVKKLDPPLKPVNVSDHCTHDSEETINVLLQPDIMPRESINEWSYVIDATLLKAASTEETVSSASQALSSSNKISLKSSCPYPSFQPNNVSLEAANALEILKNTFCSQENCIASSLENLKTGYMSKKSKGACINSNYDACLNRSSSMNQIFVDDTCCMAQSCKPPSKLHLPTTNVCNRPNCSQVRMKSDSNCFKIIPTEMSNTQRF
ncbi:PREDICTED: uncharacterized protein LOC107195071 [Dufourea novaeangliae]|nr:PREDICTED: uncharacterized protein LOC107195071 [Dufourea novaeangliae]